LIVWLRTPQGAWPLAGGALKAAVVFHQRLSFFGVALAQVSRDIPDAVIVEKNTLVFLFIERNLP
jgi:hypothetical protein